MVIDGRPAGGLTSLPTVTVITKTGERARRQKGTDRKMCSFVSWSFDAAAT